MYILITRGGAGEPLSTNVVTCWHRVEAGQSGTALWQQAVDSLSSARTSSHVDWQQRAGETATSMTKTFTQVVPTVKLPAGLLTEHVRSLSFIFYNRSQNLGDCHRQLEARRSNILKNVCHAYSLGHVHCSYVHNRCWPSMFVSLTFQRSIIVTAGRLWFTAFGNVKTTGIGGKWQWAVG